MGVEPELDDLGLCCRREPGEQGCPHGSRALRQGVAWDPGLRGILPGRVLRAVRGIWVTLVRAGDKLSAASWRIVASASVF